MHRSEPIRPSDCQFRGVFGAGVASLVSQGTGMTAAGLARGSATDLTAVAKIGPNAISRMAEAMTDLFSEEDGESLFMVAGMSHHWQQPPDAMVDEQDVIRLHSSARHRLGSDEYRRVARLAGDLTGSYVRDNRIPRPVGLLIHALPRSMGMRTLASAIKRHAWTFVGSGTLSIQRDGKALRFRIDYSPLARHVSADAPICDYYTASFQRLFQDLVDPTIGVEETRCAAAGADHCEFVIS